MKSLAAAAQDGHGEMRRGDGGEERLRYCRDGEGRNVSNERCFSLPQLTCGDDGWGSGWMVKNTKFITISDSREYDIC